MLNRFHKTTSEHWRRTSSTQKGSPFSSKEVGQNIKDKKRVKRVRNGDPPQGGSCEGGEVYKHQETLSPAGLWGFLESQREGNNKQTNNPQIMRLTITPSGEVVQKLTFASSEWGLKREGGVDCIT